jgi:hypothetical protein
MSDLALNPQTEGCAKRRCEAVTSQLTDPPTVGWQLADVTRQLEAARAENDGLRLQPVHVTVKSLEAERLRLQAERAEVLRQKAELEDEVAAVRSMHVLTKGGVLRFDLASGVTGKSARPATARARAVARPGSAYGQVSERAMMMCNTVIVKHGPHVPCHVDAREPATRWRISTCLESLTAFFFVHVSSFHLLSFHG